MPLTPSMWFPVLKRPHREPSTILDPHPVEVEEVPIGKVSALGGECAFRYVRAAIDCALARR